MFSWPYTFNQEYYDNREEIFKEIEAELNALFDKRKL